MTQRMLSESEHSSDVVRLHETTCVIQGLQDFFTHDGPLDVHALQDRRTDHFAKRRQRRKDVLRWNAERHRTMIDVRGSLEQPPLAFEGERELMRTRVSRGPAVEHVLEEVTDSGVPLGIEAGAGLADQLDDRSSHGRHLDRDDAKPRI
ncbi:MAG: hypothetical protein QM784_00980 [Polyangiaceae bacterium]